MSGTMHSQLNSGGSGAMFVVKWETLNGNVKSKRFTNVDEAQEFADKMAARIGLTQWVDINQEDA
jgi:hypothetical protein